MESLVGTTQSGLVKGKAEIENSFIATQKLWYVDDTDVGTSYCSIY